MHYNKLTYGILSSLILLSNSVIAAEYLVDADLSPTLRYDDNVELREDKEGSFSTEITPTLFLSRATEDTFLGLDAGYRIEKFTSLKELDRQDPFLLFSSSASYERSEFGLDAEYSQRAQRTIAAEDTGDFASDATVTTRSIAPRYEYQLTARDFIYTNLSYEERSYDEDQFLDNETYTLTGGWRRNFTERLTGGLALTYIDYEAESSNRTSEYEAYNLNLTSTYRLSELWSLAGQVGYNTLDSENTIISGPTFEDKSSGTLYSLSAIYEGDLNNVSIEIAKALNPSGEGVVNEQESISLDWQRQIANQLNFGLLTTYQKTTSASDFDNTDRDYMTFSPSLRWRLEENIALNLGYQFRKQEGDTVEDAESNMVFLTLNYDWGGLLYSR
jgi:predicted porin